MSPPVTHGLPFELKASFAHAGDTVTDFRFPSLYAQLPPASRMAYLRLIEPPHARRVVLLMAAFNDHGYHTRQLMARHLRHRGIATAILENPYYGLRRPHSGQPLTTATDLLVMGIGAVHDALEALRMLRQRRRWTVGVAGYSMGANIAALVAALSSDPLPCAALAGSHSPGPVFTDGALSSSVDWQALGGRHESLGRLGDLFGQASVLHFDPPDSAERAVILAVKRDGYVPYSATKALADHWSGSELHTVSGGHATALWFRKPLFADLITRSFDRFDRP